MTLDFRKLCKISKLLKHWKRRFFLCFQFVLQGVLDDILDSRMKFRWLWMSGMAYINIKEAVCKVSGLYVHWRGDSSCVSRASSKESCMTFLIPEWCLNDLKRLEWHISTLRRLCVKYQVPRCPGRGASSCVSIASSKESCMTFLIPDWSLDDFECQEWYISTLRKLCTKFHVSKCTGWGDFHHFKK